MYPYDNVKPCIKVCRKSSHEYATVAKSIVHSKKKGNRPAIFYFFCLQSNVAPTKQMIIFFLTIHKQIASNTNISLCQIG